eukprot:11579233-Heterocapsa_arctica.AAC.1
MRRTQLKLNILRKYQMLANKKQEHNEEGQTLHYKLEGNIALEHLHEIETQLEEMKTKLKNDRTQRWRRWVDNSWGHTKKDIQMYQRTGNGPLIVRNGGSAQMKDVMKLAEKHGEDSGQ